MKTVLVEAKIILSLITIIFCLSIWCPNEGAASFSYKPGDILVTDDAGVKGLVGHSGIVINATQLLHIQGPGYYPKVINISTWTKNYKTTYVARHHNAAVGSNAAQKAIRYFKDKKIAYKITTNPTDIDPYTYCSEIVWYSYWKAGLEYKIPESSPNGRVWKRPGIIKPYDFKNSFISGYNGFSLVYSIK
ncbi:hypothetical protein ACFWM3_19360 [Gottfriedia sp. NPDC058432]|uniref:hypothetical protein n=1 Tax=Gottfriedia sp. NPDC058432 TaxID=3346497 RepID=UPI0036620EFB